MRSEELPGTAEQGCGPDDAGAPPGRLGAPYSEAWGYFHLAPARPGQPSGHWATCRLCGEQVGRGPGFQAGTSELWRHLRSAHRREVEGSGAWRSPPPTSCPPAPFPAAAAEGDWARLLEQMGALAVRGSRRERELERREAAVEQAERALERRRRALQEEERAVAQARRELQAQREVLQARLREVNRREGAPLKEDLEGDRGGCVITKVLL
ncbi:zinc finger BED domain-containing protein 3 [Nycticebus coucang]|uniref:zinc finger BED domain-containing protein 3 n=1 Tax=Nycticebus coucang TaxID=9470 RepID=UPI00234CA53C|nr:zinc finger BED domain-containing protein 3 [Nycticebus coucang]XP_053444221.1 zinc finger BED domain-containing protein 3 [Nycticebus coucang]XP_053444230.1 zinc finger BED domain-containing protein 3 [Nycticebus coucang]XP_053444241.1 zinc finger BED domain-containing protein 3 [Nycticebus coucang]XP_053444249.1 zinc finger BED domain-containing protein 3 [Nycticebus coucang]